MANRFSPKQRITRSKDSPRAPSDDLETLLQKNRFEIIQALKPEFNAIHGKLSTLDERINKFESSLTSLVTKQNIQDEKIEKITNDLNNALSCLASETSNEVHQRLLRCKNVMIAGLEDQATGSVEERKEKDEEDVENILEALEEEDVDVSSIRRVGRAKGDGKKMLKVEFSSEEEKRRVLRKAKSLRHKPDYKTVFINPDRTILQQKEFRLLREELKRRKENGEDVVISKSKVVAKSSLQHFQ